MSEASLANLHPVNTLPRDEFLRRSAEGGRRAGETKKQRRECAEILKILLDKVYKDKNGAKADGRQVLMVTLLNQAVKKGDVKAIRLILSLIGEMPKPEVNITTTKDATDNGMLDELLQANLEIQKKVMRERENEQTRTECPNENSELA